VSSLSAIVASSKDVRDKTIDYSVLRENVEKVARHYRLDVQDCWQRAKNGLPRSAESYRQIAHSLRVRA